MTAREVVLVYSHESQMSWSAGMFVSLEKSTALGLHLCMAMSR